MFIVKGKKSEQVELAKNLGRDSIIIRFRPIIWRICRRIHQVRTVSNRKIMFCVECILPWRLFYAGDAVEKKVPEGQIEAEGADGSPAVKKKRSEEC